MRLQGSEWLHVQMTLRFLGIVGPRCASPQIKTLPEITLGEQNVGENTVAATGLS
jgi:hypothetical protein